MTKTHARSLSFHMDKHSHKYTKMQTLYMFWCLMKPPHAYLIDKQRRNQHKILLHGIFCHQM